MSHSGVPFKWSLVWKLGFIGEQFECVAVYLLIKNIMLLEACLYPFLVSLGRLVCRSIIRSVIYNPYYFHIVLTTSLLGACYNF